VKLTYNAGICLLALDAISHTDDAYGAMPNTKLKSAGENSPWHSFAIAAREAVGGTTEKGRRYVLQPVWSARLVGCFAAGHSHSGELWDSVGMYVIGAHQKDTGGFSYHDKSPRDPPTRSITAASIGTLALALRMATKKEMVRETIVDADYDKDKKVEKQTITVEVKSRRLPLRLPSRADSSGGRLTGR